MPQAEAPYDPILAADVARARAYSRWEDSPLPPEALEPIEPIASSSDQSHDP